MTNEIPFKADIRLAVGLSDLYSDGFTGRGELKVAFVSVIMFPNTTKNR